MSHSTFNFGQKLSQFNRTKQVLLLSELINSTVLKIEFLYIDIGCTSNYSNDAGHIQSLVETEPSFTLTCNNLTTARSAPPALYQSNSSRGNYVGFSFQKNNNERRGGFLLKYSGMFFTNKLHYKAGFPLHDTQPSLLNCPRICQCKCSGRRARSRVFFSCECFLASSIARA